MMKTIGLLGGMSWESTREYYRLLNEAVRARAGGLHSAKILLHSFDFADIAPLQNQGKWNEAGAVLASAARGLEQAGAELLLICTNTMHKVAPTVEAAISIPLVHIIDAVAADIKAKKLKTIGLLGTEFTMREAFYRDRMQQHGISVLVPEGDDFTRVNAVIFDQLCKGMFSDASRQEFHAIIERLEARGAEGIILGCTEIGLLLTEPLHLPTFDSTALHVRAAIEAAFSDRLQQKAS